MAPRCDITHNSLRYHDVINIGALDTIFTFVITGVRFSFWLPWLTCLSE